MGKVLDNKCPSCGAAIHFKPELGKFKCDYCDSEFTADELKDISNKKVAIPILKKLYLML